MVTVGGLCSVMFYITVSTLAKKQKQRERRRGEKKTVEKNMVEVAAAGVEIEISSAYNLWRIR